MNIEISLMKYADQVYNDPDIFHAKQNAYGNVYEIDGVKTIALRGSEPAVFVDWTTDLSFWPSQDSILGRCHRGFLNAANEVLNQLMTLVGEDKYYITGHSLGGALAAILGAKMAYHQRPPAHISTFGCPNITIDNNITDLLKNVPGNRWRNGNDIVPKLPFFFKSYRGITQIGHEYRNFIKAHETESYIQSLNQYYSSNNS